MIWIRRLFDFYINSSVHVALAVFALTYVTLTKFKIEFDSVSLGFNFFATILGYNFVKYLPFLQSKILPKRLTVYFIGIVSVLALVGVFFYGVFFKLKVLLLIAIFALLTLLYALPLLKNLHQKGHLSLRFIPGIKIFIIALVWSGVCVFIPILQNEQLLNDHVWLTFVEFFTIVVVLMIPFEIRDLKYDDKRLKTLPQVLGIKKTKQIGLLLCFFVFTIELFMHYKDINALIVSAVFVLTLACFMWYSSVNRSNLYCSFWVEAIPVFWMLLLF